MDTMIRVKYKGIETLLVYFIPAITSKNKKQYPKDMVYLGQPFNRIVSVKDIKMGV